MKSSLFYAKLFDFFNIEIYNNYEVVNYDIRNKKLALTHQNNNRILSYYYYIDTI